MKVHGHYYCDLCRTEVDPRGLYSVTVSRITPREVYTIEREWHFCKECIRRVQVRYPTLEDQGGV